MKPFTPSCGTASRCRTSMPSLTQPIRCSRLSLSNSALTSTILDRFSRMDLTAELAKLTRTSSPRLARPKPARSRCSVSALRVWALRDDAQRTDPRTRSSTKQTRNYSPQQGGPDGSGSGRSTVEPYYSVEHSFKERSMSKSSKFVSLTLVVATLIVGTSTAWAGPLSKGTNTHVVDDGTVSWTLPAGQCPAAPDGLTGSGERHR